MTGAAICAAVKAESFPKSLPVGVLHALTITALFIGCLLHILSCREIFCIVPQILSLIHKDH